MLTPLVDANVPVFAMSTYTTDYVLVREQDNRPATTALKIAGHTVRQRDAAALTEGGHTPAGIVRQRSCRRP
jgi:hypothetical protein